MQRGISHTARNAPHILQLHSLTWRFLCSCIVLVAASGYILLGALQIASAENRAPAAVATADATADAVAATSTDAKDDGGSAGDDDSDDASRIEDDRMRSAVATGPKGGAGVDAAAIFCNKTACITIASCSFSAKHAHRISLTLCSGDSQAAGPEKSCCFKQCCCEPTKVNSVNDSATVPPANFAAASWPASAHGNAAALALARLPPPPLRERGHLQQRRGPPAGR